MARFVVWLICFGIPVERHSNLPLVIQFALFTLLSFDSMDSWTAGWKGLYEYALRRITNQFIRGEGRASFAF